MNLLIGILFLVFIVTLTEGGRVPWWQIKVTKSQGPNACIVEEVQELGKKYWTECKYWTVRKVCGKDSIIRYECCEGYKQIDGEGCTGVKSLKSVLETARDLGARRFVSYLEDAGLSNELNGPGPFTLFAPRDEAFDGSRGASHAMLNYHIVRGRYPSKDFQGNNEIVSNYNRLKLRISKYSTGMETVNCVLISRKDQEATNGIVHFIDHPLDPTVFNQQNIHELLIQDGRFRKMVDAIDRCGFGNRLRELGSTYTLLAPSDEAFLKIPPSRLEKLISDPASCTAMLENHVIPHVMCLPVITEEFKAKSIGNGRLGFDCDGDRGHTVDGKKVGEFLLGGNGIIYVMDEVLIPDRSRTVLELAEKYNLITFLQLTSVGGLDDMFNGRGDFNVFAPSEQAWYSIDYELLDEAKQNSDLSRRLILFHANSGPRIKTSSITNNQMISSLDGENNIRLFVYRKGFGIEDAIFETSDIEGANGVLHIISKVIFPATESAGDILRKSGNYSIFLSTMESILQEDPQAIDISGNGDGSNGKLYTFFVPTDTAFRAIGSQRLRRLQSDPAQMTRLMRNHVSPSVVASDSLKPNLVYDVPTKENVLGVTCDAKNKMKVNEVDVLRQNIMSSNGVIHVLNRIIEPTIQY